MCACYCLHGSLFAVDKIKLNLCKLFVWWLELLNRWLRFDTRMSLSSLRSQHFSCKVAVFVVEIHSAGNSGNSEAGRSNSSFMCNQGSKAHLVSLRR